MTKSRGIEIIKEDDNLITAEVLEEIGMSISIFDWLKEDLSEQEFNELKPTQVVFGLIENEHVDDPEDKKARPFVCLYKADNYMVGFQITKSSKSPLCKYKLLDWLEYDLRQQSYINIDHEVELYRDDISFTKAKNLTRRDLVGLIDWLKKLAKHNKEKNYPAKYNIEADIEFLEKELKK